MRLGKREGAPSAEQLSAVVRGWAGNAARRANDEAEREWVTAIRWLEKNTVDLSSLEDPNIARAVLDALALKMDGRPAAPTTIARKRAVLHNAFELAVERELLERNPLDRIRWKAPKVADAIDPRSVINPQQARALLDAVAAQAAGRRLVAFFGCLYYSAMRPSEALALRREDLHLPDTDDGWGELLISRSNPQVSTAWTDHGLRRPRQLKHRARGEVRRVPVPPQLVVLLRAHLAEFCADGSPRVFRGAQHAEVQQATYAMVWRRARKAALSATEYESSVGRRPYDLRHAAVSIWLAAGVDSIQVAAWAGLQCHRPAPCLCTCDPRWRGAGEAARPGLAPGQVIAEMINSPEMKSRIAPALSYLNVRMADMPNDPDWTRSELILVCEALRANGWQAIRATDPRAVHLSGLLRAMDIHPRGSRSDKFRSAASVQLKGYDLLNQLPGYDGKPTRGGRLDDAWTWRCRSHSPYPVLGQTSESGRRAFD